MSPLSSSRASFTSTTSDQGKCGSSVTHGPRTNKPRSCKHTSSDPTHTVPSRYVGSHLGETVAANVNGPIMEAGIVGSDVPSASVPRCLIGSGEKQSMYTWTAALLSLGDNRCDRKASSHWNRRSMSFCIVVGSGLAEAINVNVDSFILEAWTIDATGTGPHSSGDPSASVQFCFIVSDLGETIHVKASLF